MKIKLLIPGYIFLCPAVNAQYNVTPGGGIDKAMLGMPVEKIIAIIGKPSKIVSCEAEKKDWQNFGYDVTNKLVFSISFDKVHIFNGTTNPYAIWKIYTRNDTAVIFNLSSYQCSKTVTNKITISDSLRFYENMRAVKNVLGYGYEKYVDEAKNTHIIYKERGVLFIVNEDKVRNVFLFAPLPQQALPPCRQDVYTYAPVINLQAHSL